MATHDTVRGIKHLWEENQEWHPETRDRKPTHSEFDAAIMGVLPPLASVPGWYSSGGAIFSGSRNIGQ